jgi:hypothetical protein
LRAFAILGAVVTTLVVAGVGLFDFMCLGEGILQSPYIPGAFQGMLLLQIAILVAQITILATNAAAMIALSLRPNRSRLLLVPAISVILLWLLFALGCNVWPGGGDNATLYWAPVAFLSSLILTVFCVIALFVFFDTRSGKGNP